jgi:hypothetical protein
VSGRKSLFVNRVVESPTYMTGVLRAMRSLKLAW